MASTLRQSEIEECIRNPVFAVWVYFGIELDTFQSACLKVMWFSKEVIDSAGINTGKTFRLLLWACLRVILLPNPPHWKYPGRLVGAFYQESGSVDEIFLKEMESLIALPGAELFRRELRRQARGRLGYHRTKNSVNYHFRNGGYISAPALNVARQAKTMAGRRYSDGYVEEYTEIDESSGALDEQIIDRINRVDYNPHHPVWCNHLILSAHAQDPDSHPSAARIKQFKELIRDGSTSHALITSSSLDWTDGNETFKVKREKAIADRKRDSYKLGKAKIAQKHDGIWKPGGADWYDSSDREACLRLDLDPEDRPMPGALYSLGWDTATSGGAKADYNAGVVWRGIQVTERQLGQVGVMPFDDGTFWYLAPVAAVAAKDRSGPQSSGIIHSLHRRYGMGRIVMDPGGGGQLVLKDMWQKNQLIDGVSAETQGLCLWGMEHEYPEAQAIVSMFQPTSPRLLHVWDPGFERSTDGVIDNMHRKMQAAFQTRTVAWPARAEERGAAGMKKLNARQKRMLARLDEAYAQFGSIRYKTDKDGEAKMTSNGFHSFEAKGKRKKDIAYAALYGFIGLISLISDPEVDHGGRGEDDDDGAAYS